MGSRWHTVVVDARDPARLARWWGEVLEYDIVHEATDGVALASKEGAHPRLAFVLVRDSRTVKNRLHFDLNPDNQEAEVERLVNMGARYVDIGQKEVPWVVLADPEGNEFCVMTAREQ